MYSTRIGLLIERKIDVQTIHPGMYIILILDQQSQIKQYGKYFKAHWFYSAISDRRYKIRMPKYQTSFDFSNWHYSSYQCSRVPI